MTINIKNLQQRFKELGCNGKIYVAGIITVEDGPILFQNCALDGLQEWVAHRKPTHIIFRSIFNKGGSRYITVEV